MATVKYWLEFRLINSRPPSSLSYELRNEWFQPHFESSARNFLNYFDFTQCLLPLDRLTFLSSITPGEPFPIYWDKVRRDERRTPQSRSVLPRSSSALEGGCGERGGNAFEAGGPSGPGPIQLPNARDGKASTISYHRAQAAWNTNQCEFRQFRSVRLRFCGVAFDSDHWSLLLLFLALTRPTCRLTFTFGSPAYRSPTYYHVFFQVVKYKNAESIRDNFKTRRWLCYF